MVMQVQPRNCRRQDLSVELFSTVLQILTFRVNTTGNQNTTGNAATATKLQTARKISGVPFDGSTDITLTAAHVAAFARRATGSYADADGGVPRMPNQALTMSPALATAIFWLTSIPESEVAAPCR